MCSYYKLMEVCNIETGKLDANAMVKDGAFPFYTCDRKPYRIDSYAFDCECVLIGGNNASGNFPINYYNGKFNAYQRTYVITLKDNVDINIRYIFHALKLELLKIKKRSRGSLTKFLTIGLLENIMLPKLNKNEYEEISTQIDSYDKLIEENALLIKNLEEYSQLLFHKWFIDFNFPDKNGNPYKDAGGELIDVDGKMIPVGWQREEINTLVKIKTDSLNPQEHASEPFKHYSIPVFDEKGTYGTEIGSSINSNKYVLNENNILVSKLNPWFKRVVYPYKVEKAICSTEFVVWEPIADNLLETLYIIANTNNFTTYCSNASTGTSNSHKRVNPEFMVSYKINYNRKILEQFNSLIKPFIVKIHMCMNENQLLEETRDLLIKKLIK